MKLNEAIVILENHNEWRRDKEVPNSIVMVDPLELGIAIDVVVSEVKNFNISGVGVPKGTLPKDIDFIPKKSWELFNEHFDLQTSNKHTRHWNFMEGVRIALKHKK